MIVCMKMAYVLLALIVGWTLLVFNLLPRHLSSAASSANKKLILFQQQLPSATYVASHPAEVDALPYEGIFLTLPSMDGMRSGAVIPVSQFTQELVEYKAMHAQLTKVRRNFVYVRLVKTGPFASQTANTAQNLANLAQAARDAGLTGIAFDNEDYENDIWDPSITCPGKNVDACQQEAVTAGKTVMQAIIAKWPDVVFISMLGPYFGDADIFQAVLHEAPLPKHLILGAYTVGMNEATIGTNATYVDGGEKFSVHTSAEADADYALRKTTMSQSSNLIPQAIKTDWKNAISLAFTLYDEQAGTPARWQEDIRVNAQAADEYAWAFSFAHVWLGPPGADKLQAGADWIQATVTGRTLAGMSPYPTVDSATPTTSPSTTPSPTQSLCDKQAGDADCNGTVALTDFAIWKEEYSGSLGADTDGDGNVRDADFNTDSRVTLIDYEIWRVRYLAGDGGGGGGGGGGDEEVVAIPAAPTNLALVPRPGFAWGNRVNCSTKEPVCAFGWQENDVYIDPQHQSYPAKVEWRNVETGAIIATVNLPSIADAPINGARVYPIYNPDEDNWFVVYHATRKGGPVGSNQTSIYGVLFDAAGNPQGSAIEVYDGNFSGWTPHGYYDTSSKLFYMEWHQQTSSLGGRKDITAALVDGTTGALVQTGLKLHDTPENLEEYSGSAFNPIRGEGLSVFAANTGACDEGCLTKATINRHATSRDGLSFKGDQRDIDNNAATFEWYISTSFNPTTKRYVVVYGQSSSPHRGGPQISVKAQILDMDGATIGNQLSLGEATPGNFYWQTGTSCSSHNNLCLVTFKEKAVYIDSTKSDQSAVGAVFAVPTGGGTSKVAYSPVTKQFVVFGQAGYARVNSK